MVGFDDEDLAEDELEVLEGEVVARAPNRVPRGWLTSG
jgi:hypothetical protein